MKTFLTVILVSFLFVGASFSQNYQDSLKLYIPIQNSVADSGKYQLAVSSVGSLVRNRMDMINGALSLNGINSYIQFGDTSVLRPTAFTITGWFCFNSVPSGTVTLFGKNIGTATFHSFNLSYENKKLCFHCGNLSGNGDTTCSQMFALPNIWFHIAVTADQAKKIQKLYVNGLLIDSTMMNKTIDWDNNVILIGASHDNNSYCNYFPGITDDIRIYSGILSTKNVNAVMNDEYLFSPVISIIRSRYNAARIICGGGFKENKNAVKVYPSVIHNSEGDGLVHIEYESSEDMTGNYIRIIDVTGTEKGLVPINSSEMSISTKNLNGMNFLLLVDKNKSLLDYAPAKIIVLP